MDVQPINIIHKHLKKIFPFALGAMALASCTQPMGKIKEYCEEYDKSAVEYKECIDKCEGKFSPKDQAVLDSLVYRDLLNTTKLAKDSSAIAEFNKIAATNKYDEQKYSDFENNLLENGISTKEYNNIRSHVSPAGRQFESDKVLYGKLFREKGVMTKEFEARFKAFSRFLDPSINSEAWEIESDYKELIKK